MTGTHNPQTSRYSAVTPPYALIQRALAGRYIVALENDRGFGDASEHELCFFMLKDDGSPDKGAIDELSSFFAGSRKYAALGQPVENLLSGTGYGKRGRWLSLTGKGLTKLNQDDFLSQNPREILQELVDKLNAKYPDANFVISPTAAGETYDVRKDKKNCCIM